MLLARTGRVTGSCTAPRARSARQTERHINTLDRVTEEKTRRNSACQGNQSRRSKKGKNLYLLVTATGEKPTISLVEPDDCHRFHVTIKDLSEQAAQQILEVEYQGKILLGRRNMEPGKGK